MGVSPRFSTPGHPESMGAVERWNRTLKDMLSKNVQEHGSDWDLHLPFCYSHIGKYPQYNRHVAIPISIRTFAFGTHISSRRSVGPATIIEITRPYSAKVELDDGGIRELHFNKLRPYVARVGQVGLIFDQDSDFGDLHYAPTDMAVSSMGDVTDHISSDCQELDDVQRLELLNTLGKFSSLFSSLPGLAKVKGHNLKLKPDFTPKKMHPYRIPIALQQEVDRQINELLHLKLIEPSESEWAHPIVCVSKKNGSIRLCVDYRHLNSFTIADAYPMQNAKDLLFEVGQANYITVLDLTKGYWQIPMAEEAKPYTAFVTHHGHYQFCVMPFGMKNAGSTFQKLWIRC
ncbi:hypothetical protein TNCV_5135821 [Trichonephila clavipes]|nr:hypothetical protein TNCV_5135821 [Trichonephila clavipes]